MRVQPGPPDDPYSTIEGVKFLDEKIAQLEVGLRRIARISRKDAELSSIERAAFQLIPASASIAKSIRQAVKSGHLLSAAILLRPLLERVATLAYLESNPQAVTLWESGWPHGQRPSLRTRLQAILPEAGGAVIAGFMQDVANYNSLIHGDPAAARVSLAQVEQSSYAYISDKDYVTPERAHGISFSAALNVVFLLLVIDRVFPSSR